MSRLRVAIVARRALSLGVILLSTSCGQEPRDANGGSAASNGLGRGYAQTRLPGHPSTGGQTSGMVMATQASAPSQDMGAATRQGGTPGIPQGAGDNTSGTEMGGTTGTSALANTGEQTAAQRTPGEGAPAHAEDGTRGIAPAGGASGPVAAAVPPSAAVAAVNAAAAASAASAQPRLLDERMSAVAQRWQERSRRQGGAPPARPAAASSASP